MYTLLRGIIATDFVCLCLHIKPDQGGVSQSRLSEVHQQLGQCGGE